MIRLVRCWVVGVLWVCGAVLSTHAHAAYTYTVQDDRGVTLSFASAPQRIVSLLPSLTETVCELGACARLVGVDRYSNYPASVTHLPQLGGGLDPNIEAIMALQPDVVLVAKSSRVAERLQALGLKVLAFEPKTHEDVQRIVLRLGDLLQVRDAQHIWRAIDAGVSAAAQSLPPAVRQLRVYFEVNEGPYAAGEASFIGQTLARLGVRNIVPVSLGAFPRLNPEYVVRAEPDVIMIGQRSVTGLSSRPGWSRLKALRTGRVCAFAQADADVLVRPGPRMAEAARIMANCLLAQVAQKGRAP